SLTIDVTLFECDPLARLWQPTSAESLDRLPQQPAQFLDRLRLAVVLRQVLIDQLAEHQRATAASLTAHPFQCSLERLARVALGRETTPLHTSGPAATGPVAEGPNIPAGRHLSA